MDKKIATPSSRKAANLPGIFDIITSADSAWQTLLENFDRYASQYGFTRLELPVAEDPQLYQQVYASEDARVKNLVVGEAAGRHVAFRSSLLPSMLRLLSQVRTQDPKLTKWVYSGTVIQDGQKQLAADYEFGLEVWGSYNHLTEAQVLGAAWQLFSSIGLSDVAFEVNTCGSESCQETYGAALRDYLKGKRYQLCDACADNLQDHPLAVLRCQNLDCQSLLSEAPTILDYLDEASRKHFTNLLEALEELQIPYQLNPLLAGMEGASGTIAVLKLKLDGRALVVAQAEGHTNLVQKLGGKNVHAFGLHGSFLQLHQALIERGAVAKATPKRPAEVYLVPLGELAAKRSLRLFRDLVEGGMTVFDYFGYVGVKNQLKAAQEAGSPVALIMGQKEAVDEVVILRDVKSGMQEVFSYDKIVDEVRKRLGR